MSKDKGTKETKKPKQNKKVKTAYTGSSDKSPEKK